MAAWPRKFDRYGGLHQRDGRPSGHDGYDSSGLGAPSSAYRPATPNSRGQYSHAVLDELESQNDAAIEAMSNKVKMLKDITTAIGVDVRESTNLVNSMNDTFENTRFKLRGTMNRMLRMAEKTGVSWKVWALFICAVCTLFWYIWLF